MSAFYIAAVVLVLLLLFGALVASKKRDVTFPYRKKPALFTPAERSFLGVLEKSLEANYRVFGMVRMADVVAVNRMANRALRQQAFNRIQAKHFDFVICRCDDLSIVCVIELDDASHRKPDRKARDAFVRGVCEASALPLLQVEARASYSIELLRLQLKEAIQKAAENSISTPEGR